MTIININEIDLYYEIHGEGEPLLFLHGLGSSSQDWEPQIDFFAQEYQVIVPDVRGHGRTDKPRHHYSVPQFAADIVGLLHHLDAAPVNVVGLSMGGMIAFQMAVDHPELLRSMVIVNSAPALTPRGWQEWMQVSQRQIIMRVFGMRKIGEFLAPKLFPREGDAGKRQYFIEQWAKNDKRAYINSFTALLNWSVKDRISHIKIPTLILASDEDYTTVTYKEEYMKLMPNASITVIEDARHAVPAEHPDKFNTVLAKFLSENLVSISNTL